MRWMHLPSLHCEAVGRKVQRRKLYGALINLERAYDMVIIIIFI